MYPWTCSVKIGVVGAHLPFTVGLFYHDEVGEPDRVPGFSDEIGFLELVHFFSDHFVLFFSIYFFFCDTNLARGQMTNLWHIMLGWIPDMSDGFQANKFMFLCRTLAMSMYSWMVRSRLSCVHWLGLGLSCSLMSSLIGFRTLSEVSSCGFTSNTSSRLSW